jgi:uncharacterized membrane protein
MKALREGIALCALLFTVATAALRYGSLPQRIPTHWGISGAVNGWGDKSSLWSMVAVGCIVYAALSAARFVPERAISIPVSPEQRAEAIPIALEMIAWMKAELVCLFAFNVQAMISVAEGRATRMFPWALPLSLIVLFATIAFYLARMMTLGTPRDTTS